MSLKYKPSLGLLHISLRLIHPPEFFTLPVQPPARFRATGVGICEYRKVSDVRSTNRSRAIHPPGTKTARFRATVVGT